MPKSRAAVVAIGTTALVLWLVQHISGLASAAPPEENPHPALRDRNGDQHACLTPAGEKSEEFDCFTSLGPNRFAGRVRALAIHPDDVDTIWAASASGGLWVSRNAGDSWSRGGDISRTLAFSSLAIDPQNRNVMYAGSGEIHMTLHLLSGEVGSDAGLGLRSPRRGFGIFKTTDGGAHWSELTNTTLNKDFFYVSRIAVHPQNSNIVLAATATGLWRSTNGGATWSRAVTKICCFNGREFDFPILGVFLDVKFHRLRSSNVVASGLNGAVYFSTDGSATFRRTTLPTNVPAGLAADASTRVELAVDNSGPGEWFAAQIFDGGANPIVLLHSNNSGNSFTVRSDPDGVGCFSNRLYTGALFAPGSGTHVFVGGIELCHSSDRGQTFAVASETSQMHNDYHSIVPGGRTSLGNGTLVVANDGGVFRIFDPTRPGFPEFVTKNLNNGLVNQQTHGAARNPSGDIVAGFQDIGTLRRNASDGVWRELIGGVGGSDGMMTATDPTQADVFYFGKSQARLYRSIDSGGRECIAGPVDSPLFDMGKEVAGCTPSTGTATRRCLGVTPVLVDPHTFPGHLYVGCERLWRSNNPTQSRESIDWRAIKPPDPRSVGSGNPIVISSMALALWDQDVMWVGTTRIRQGHPMVGIAGDLWMTTQLRASLSTLRSSWQQVTDPILPQRPVSGVALHPTDPTRVYVSYSGWTSTDFNNVSNNLFRGIQDGGGEFQFRDISAGLPGGPVYSVALSPTGRIAVGTEFGARISNNDGATWSLAGPRVAVAQVTWLDDNRLLVASYGRGVFTLNL